MPSTLLRSPLWLCVSLLLPLLLLAALPARAARIAVSFENRSAVTASNVGAAVGQSNGNFSSGDGQVGIASTLDVSIGSTSFDLAGENATGEIGVRFGIEADHCLGAGGCGGGDHFVDADAELTAVIVVDPEVAAWELRFGVQSFGNINGVVDGGTLPACTSEMSASALEVSVTGGALAQPSPSVGTTAVSDAGDCTQDSVWFKDEELFVTVSGSGGGTFELSLRQPASVRSVRQTDLFAIKNGSDTCYRAGLDPGDGVAFYDACDYPGLADSMGDRDLDGILGDEPNDGGVWVTDRLGAPAVEVTELVLATTEIPALPGAGAAALGLGLLAAAARWLGRGGR